MLTRRTSAALMAAASIVATASPTLLWSAHAQTALPGPLVTPQWLNQHLKEVVVLDVRDDLKQLTAEPKFKVDAATGVRTLSETGGRIPGALSVDFNKIARRASSMGCSSRL